MNTRKDTDVMQALSMHESAKRRRLELVIAEGLKKFVEVGSALMEIRDSRLYRDEYENFESYCRERWNLARNRAYQLIDAARVTERIEKDLSTPGGQADFDECESGPIETIPAPQTEKQARPLTRLPEEQQAEAWKEAVQESNGHPTSQAVQEVVDRRLGKPPKSDPAPPKPAGRSRVNGVAMEDPPEIAEARAAGKIAPDVVVEIDEPEPGDDHPEQAGEEAPTADDEMSDEEWLATLPTRAELSGAQRATFDADALIYRHLESHRKTFAYHATRIINKARRKGPYAWRVTLFLKADHPRHWIKCPAPDQGGCGGEGTTMLGECTRCKGKGYWLNG